MSGPITINFLPSDENPKIEWFGKTSTTAISPMGISQVNSTKNKKFKKMGGKRTSIFIKNKVIEHKKANMSYEKLKKK